MDAAVADAGRLGGREFREPCEDNLDCLSGWCVPFEDHNVCSQLCLNDGCPGGWGCHAVGNTRPDVTFICFPPGHRLCGGCVQDEDCPGGRCHEVDGQQVCGLDCEADETCPGDYVCGEDGQCTPQTNSCTCDARSEGQVRLCQTANEHGTCVGRETCDPETGWQGCDAQIAVAEVCNALDDDCNGLPDDIVGLGDICTREVESNGEILSCGGRLICTRDALEPQCTALEPGPERCNFIDDDCDGDTDEGFEARGTVCLVGTGLCERVGVNACSEDELTIACDVEPGAPIDELCNGLDDNCDGQTDEAWPDLNQGCSVGQGACRRPGTIRCAHDGVGTACSAVAGAAVDELCNGVDDDCDGLTDETFAGLFTACEVGVGVCRRQGFHFCTDDGLAVACTADAAEPGAETCNGLDDNCDGTVDEGFPGVNVPCSDGVGLCLRPGVTVCSPDGAQVVCNATPGAPLDERCNGLDDDCNGEIDESFPELDTVCEVGVGACTRIGLMRCAPDGEGTLCSARAVEPGEDICNGVDDDCDGEVDEDFPLREQACSMGEGLCARAGLYRCTDDGSDVACDAVPADPSAEICDGFDNNCDGTTDEGFAGLNTPCSAGDGACRRAGIRVCSPQGDGVTCNAVAADPVAEICNGLDDNCDGTPDEDWPDLLTACQVGQGACLRNGVRVCSPDGASSVCDVPPGAPSDEICNGLDDNCDGTIDEGFVGIGTACTAGQGACLRNGVRTCSPNGAAVICNATAGEPAAERCNGLDDNCDGQTDEGFDGLGTACSNGAGACLRNGVRVCSANGAAVTCNAVPAAPVPETCNAIDDNCNGQTDEGFDGLGTACSTGTGACLRNGVRVCSANGAAVTCNAVPGAPVAEACNAIDDNCDGQTDEGFDGLGQPCTAGQGACLRQGVRLCAPDGADVICTAEPGQANAERCNAIDDDCDGLTDETFPQLNRACEAGVGACRQVGVQICTPDGAATACDAEAGAPAAEACNGLDDNCDGQTDEVWPNLGRACEAGVGACRRGGVYICGDDDAICDAAAGAPVAETCNYRDDNCDGQIDDGFVNGAGLYTTSAHCGACGADCAELWAPNAAAFGVSPRCAVNAGVAQCSFDCLEGFRDADGVPENGCELVLDDGAIYVSTPENGGLFANDCGSVDRPCASVNDGLDRAAELNRGRVRVSDGVYRETVDLRDDIALLGGHHRVTWRRDAALNVTVIEGQPEGGEPHRYGVRAVGLTTAVLDGFVVRSPSPLITANSYGVYLRDCGPGVEVLNNRIFAGDGGRGLDGAAGDSGDAGRSGHAGLAGLGVVNPGSCARAGGTPGLRTCGVTVIDGGTGGTQNACPAIGDPAGTGADGRAVLGGIGGAGAWHFESPNNGSCTVDPNGPTDARSGGDGFSGTDAAGGAGAAAGGSAAEHWTGNTGLSGTTGVHGGGGGGGGAAAGVDVEWSWRAYDLGATGGGGGSGGCAGDGGNGAVAGGGSFAVFITFSGAGPAQLGDLPILRDNVIQRGLGGNGGNGGIGGGGGEGGPGGAGGAVGAPADMFMAFCSLQGGDGGQGGRGGHGSGGGGGQGGASYDVFVANANGLAPTFADNAFGLADDLETAGQGGLGGNSSNVINGRGGPGADGNAGRVGTLP
jgi:hypothetical protein